MMYNQGWNCPKCGKAHGPHVNTCPESSPYTPTTWPNTYPSPTMTQQCPKCGLQLSPVMGYVCSKYGCPTGLGPAVSYLTETKD